MSHWHEIEELDMDAYLSWCAMNPNGVESIAQAGYNQCLVWCRRADDEAPLRTWSNLPDHIKELWCRAAFEITPERVWARRHEGKYLRPWSQQPFLIHVAWGHITKRMNATCVLVAQQAA